MRSSVCFFAGLCVAASAFAAPVPAAKPGAKEKEAEPAGFKYTFEKPEKKSFAEFPAVTLRSTQTASYIGLQFGTGKLDVAYVCFDPESAQDAADRGYVHIASSTNPPIPIRGHTVQEKQDKNVKIKPPKAYRFELPPLRTRIGNAEVLYKAEVTCGHANRANVHLFVEGAMKEEKLVTFVLHANLSNLCVPVPNEIKVIPLLGPVTLQIFQQDKVHPPWVRPYLTIGENILFEPVRGIDDSFFVELKNKENDKIVDKGKLKLKIPEYSGVGDNGAGENFELKGAKVGGRYEATASIDLGPFGHPSVFVPVGGGVVEKKKK